MVVGRPFPAQPWMTASRTAAEARGGQTFHRLDHVRMNPSLMQSARNCPCRLAQQPSEDSQMHRHKDPAGDSAPAKDPEKRDRLMKGLDVFLERDRDRELFDLPNKALTG